MTTVLTLAIAIISVPDKGKKNLIALNKIGKAQSCCGHSNLSLVSFFVAISGDLAH